MKSLMPVPVFSVLRPVAPNTASPPTASRIAGFSNLCSKIHLAAKNPRRWADALLAIRNYFEAECVNLTWHGKPDFPGSFTLASPASPDSVHSEYAEAYLPVDPLSRVAPGVLRTTYEADIEPLWRRYCETYGSRFNCHHGLAAGFAAETQEHYTFRVFRGEGAPDFTPDDVEYFQALVAQLAQAVGWQRDWICTRAETSAFSEALDDFSVPTLVLDALGYVTSANHSARRLLDDLAGPAWLQDERLHMRTPHDQSRFTNILEEARKRPSRTTAMLCANLNSSQRWTLVVRAIPGSNGVRGTPTWMLMWRNCQEVIRLDADLLRSVFDLTPTEIKIAASLASAATLQEAGTSLNIRPATARAHLRAIFRKTSVQRQLELVQLLRHFGERQTTSL